MGNGMDKRGGCGGVCVEFREVATMSTEVMQKLNKAADLQTQIIVLENITAMLKKEFKTTVAEIHDTTNWKEWDRTAFLAKELGVQL